MVISITPTLMSNNMIITDPSAQMAYVIINILKDPGNISTLNRSMKKSMRTILQTYDNEHGVRNALERALNEVTSRIVNGVNVVVTSEETDEKNGSFVFSVDFISNGISGIFLQSKITVDREGAINYNFS